MKNPRVEVYLGIGSNVDSENNIRISLAALDKEFVLLKQSSVYKSPPINGRGQDYLNLVVALQTDMPLCDLSKHLKSIEDTQGRERLASISNVDTVDNRLSQKKILSTRVTIDLDILFYGDSLGEVEGITLPHQDILSCPHVLKPLTELAPNVNHPIEELTMEQLWQKLYSQKPSELVKVDLY